MPVIRPPATQKPGLGAKINRASPLARQDLKGAWLFNENGGAPFESLGTGKATLSGSIWGVGRLIHDTTTDKTTLASDSTRYLTTNAGFTYAFGYRKRDATSRESAVIGLDRSSANLTARANIHLPFNDGIIYWDYGGVTAGTSRLTISASGIPLQTDAVWVFTTGARGMEIWQNGRKLTSNTGNSTRTADTSALALGRFDTPTAATSDLVDYTFFLIYHGQLSEAEIDRVSRRPYSLWTSPPIVLWGAAGISFPTDLIAASDSAVVVASEGTPSLSIIDSITALDSIPLVLSDTAALTQEINKPNVADSLGMSLTEVSSVLQAFVITAADSLGIQLIEELPDRWFTVNPALLTMAWQEFVKSAGGPEDALVIMWDEQRDSADTLTFQWVEIRDEIDKLSLIWREVHPVYTTYTASTIIIPTHRLQVT